MYPEMTQELAKSFGSFGLGSALAWWVGCALIAALCVFGYQAIRRNTHARPRR